MNPETHFDLSTATSDKLRGRQVLDKIQSGVQTAIQFALEEPPEPGTINVEIAAVLIAPDSPFKLWPLTNERGQQSEFIRGLSEAVLERLKCPAVQEEEVAAAYLDAGTALPDVPFDAAGEPTEVVAEAPETTDDADQNPGD